MKTFLLAVAVIAFASFTLPVPAPVKKGQQFFYCLSKPFPPQPSPVPQVGKNTVLYTEITSADEQKIDPIVNSWMEYVKAHCENTEGCSSDLNYCTSLEDGEQQIKKILSRYADTSKYIVKKVALTDWK